MLTAFALVIGLGICGMLALIGLTVAGIWHPHQARGDLQETQQSWTQLLSDYYNTHGGWEGVDRQLADLPAGPPMMFTSYVLVDERGRVVASNLALSEGASFDRELLRKGSKIVVRGRIVGTFLLQPGVGPFAGPPPTAPLRPTFGPTRASTLFWPVLRNFMLAGVGLALVLQGMAFIFVRRIVRPLRSLTAATHALAAGQLDVQVPGASVRELDELARSFNGMARALAQADQQRRQMTADIAHELRTPLTIIKGRLEGLQDGVYSPTPDQIAQLLSETALLERLIEDLRLLALAEAGQLPLFREIIDPAELLEDTAASFAAQAATHRVQLRVEAPDDLPQLDVDPQRMLQVLANLVTNALRYTSEGGTIVLRALERKAGDQGNTVVIQVCDTGQGIPAEDLPHIFDRFWRADRSRGRSSGGVGLGLAIARQIVVAHGGTVWAESRLGHGTTISVEIPAVA